MRLWGWFAVGFLWEAILTADILFTAARWVSGAGATTFVLNVLSFTVYGRIISQVDKGTRLENAVAISLGASCGAMLSIMYI